MQVTWDDTAHRSPEGLHTQYSNRQRCYWHSAYWKWQNSSFCATNTAKACTGPVWCIRTGADAYKVPVYHPQPAKLCLYRMQPYARSFAVIADASQVRCNVSVARCRELAFQLADQFRALGSGMSLKVCLTQTGHAQLYCSFHLSVVIRFMVLQELVIVGGLEMQQQAKALARRPHIVVATPGRLKVSCCLLCSMLHLKQHRQRTKYSSDLCTAITAKCACNSLCHPSSALLRPCLACSQRLRRCLLHCRICSQLSLIWQLDFSIRNFLSWTKLTDCWKRPLSQTCGQS